MSEKTTDHKKIKAWAEAREMYPSRVKGTMDMIRFNWDDNEPEENLVKISWDVFFEAFEKNGLAFLYEEKTDTGKLSRFNKFVSRE